MQSKLLAGLSLAISLTAYPVGAQTPDLTPSGPFDASADAGRVQYCYVADLEVAEIGSEVLALDENVWGPADALVGERFQRLKPFAEAVRRAAGGSEAKWDAAMAADAPPYVNGYELRHTGANAAELFAEAVDQTVKCDALVQSWGAPPPN